MLPLIRAVVVSGSPHAHFLLGSTVVRAKCRHSSLRAIGEALLLPLAPGSKPSHSPPVGAGIEALLMGVDLGKHPNMASPGLHLPCGAEDSLPNAGKEALPIGVEDGVY